MIYSSSELSHGFSFSSVEGALNEEERDAQKGRRITSFDNKIGKTVVFDHVK